MKKLFHKLFFLSLVLSIVFVKYSALYGHSLWINLTDYAPEAKSPHGASTKMYLGWGHHYPVDDFISEALLEELSVIEPDGTKSKIDANRGQYMATRLNFKKQGTHYVVASLKPGFYTMYLEGEEVQHRIGPKTGLKNVLLSIYYEMYAKALVKVGESDEHSYSKPIGQRLEIVPLNDPSKMKLGDFFQVKVLFDGKPARYTYVFAKHNGFSTEDDFSFVTTTDSQGIAKIRITSWGPHLVKANMRVPAPEHLKDKCDALDYSATLTFSIP